MPSHFCESIHRDSSTSLSKELLPYRERMQNQTGVYVLEEGDASMVSRAWLSEYAEKTIDIQYFIFSVDNVGLIACDYLLRAADRGVKVRILVDDIMVEASGKELLTLAAHPNIDIRIYNPGVNLGKNIYQKLSAFCTHFRGANQRMHNKVFLVDGQIGITGGRNIADEYFDYNHEYNFRDRDVLLLGKVTQSMQRSFHQFWTHRLSVPVETVIPDSLHEDPQTKYTLLHEYTCNPENFWPQVRNKIAGLPQAFHDLQDASKIVWTQQVDFVSDVPGKNQGNDLHGGGITTDTLTHLLMSATKSIDIQSPYVIVTPSGLQLFADAVKRGVRVRMLTNSLASTDNLEAFAAYQKCRSGLLRAGVQLFEFRPDAADRYKLMTGALQKKINFAPTFGLHAKSMVIDKGITVIGTFNLDPRSANLNTECVTIIHDQIISRSVLQGMEVEYQLQNAWPSTLLENPDHKASLYKRMKTVTRRVVPKAIL